MLYRGALFYFPRCEPRAITAAGAHIPETINSKPRAKLNSLNRFNASSTSYRGDQRLVDREGSKQAGYRNAARLPRQAEPRGREKLSSSLRER